MNRVEQGNVKLAFPKSKKTTGFSTFSYFYHLYQPVIFVLKCLGVYKSFMLSVYKSNMKLMSFQPKSISHVWSPRLFNVEITSTKITCNSTFEIQIDVELFTSSKCHLFHVNSCFILNEISTNFQSGISMSNQCGLDEGMSVGMQHELTMLQNKSSLAKALCWWENHVCEFGQYSERKKITTNRRNKKDGWLT